MSYLRLKCTKFIFCWGSATDHAGGAYIAPLDPLEGQGKGGKKGKGKRMVGKGLKEWEGRAGKVPMVLAYIPLI